VNGPIKLHRVLEDVAARELLLKLAAAQKVSAVAIAAVFLLHTFRILAALLTV
jgi:hypothetical protein